MASYVGTLTQQEVEDRAEFAYEACCVMRERIVPTDTFEHYGFDVEGGRKRFLEAGQMDDFRNLLPARIMPAVLRGLHTAVPARIMLAMLRGLLAAVPACVVFPARRGIRIAVFAVAARILFHLQPGIRFAG